MKTAIILCMSLLCFAAPLDYRAPYTLFDNLSNSKSRLLRLFNLSLASIALGVYAKFNFNMLKVNSYLKQQAPIAVMRRLAGEGDVENQIRLAQIVPPSDFLSSFNLSEGLLKEEEWSAMDMINRHLDYLFGNDSNDIQKRNAFLLIGRMAEYPAMRTYFVDYMIKHSTTSLSGLLSYLNYFVRLKEGEPTRPNHFKLIAELFVKDSRLHSTIRSSSINLHDETKVLSKLNGQLPPFVTKALLIEIFDNRFGCHENEVLLNNDDSIDVMKAIVKEEPNAQNSKMLFGIVFVERDLGLTILNANMLAKQLPELRANGSFDEFLIALGLTMAEIEHLTDLQLAELMLNPNILLKVQ